VFSENETHIGSRLFQTLGKSKNSHIARERNHQRVENRFRRPHLRHEAVPLDTGNK